MAFTSVSAAKSTAAAIRPHTTILVENGPMRVVFTFVISFGIGTSIMEHSSLHIERLPGSKDPSCL